MSKPLIYLAFTDDWELRGDGSGDMNAIQIEPMRRLLSIFEKHQIRMTFMAELMQQLTFRKRQDEFPELKKLADRWDEAVSDAYSRGHDVQLHIHPQWSSADYDHGKWRLKGDWSQLNYEPRAAAAMISEGKLYLENLLKAIEPDYKCVAFRAGYSVVAPSPFMLNLLVEQGIVFDISIVGGLRLNTRKLQFDYTGCDEDFLPFYPRMDDARRVSETEEPIVCVPIFQFTGSRRHVIKQIASKVTDKLKERFDPAEPNEAKTDNPVEEWAEIGRSGLPFRVYDKVVAPAVFGKHLTADTGQLDFPLLCEMMEKVRYRAKASGQSRVPVVLTNHSKYMKDYEGFDRFLRLISGADDVECITLSDLAEMLQAGEFEIRKAAG